MFSTLEQPGIGSYLVPASPLNFSAAGRLPARRAPLLGEHTEEILADVLGLSEAEIGRLFDARDGGRRRRPRLALPPERPVERDRGRREVAAAHERERILRAPLAVHPGVLPLDRERAFVADPVERAEHPLEVDVAVAGGDEVPAAAGGAEVGVAAEDGGAAVEPELGVLDVGVVDARRRTRR